MSSWRTLDRILSCCCCFEVVGNDRLIMLCFFAVCQVFVVDVGVGGGGWEGVEPSLMSVWLSLEYVPSSSCCPLSKSGNDRRVLSWSCSFADTLVSPTPLCRGEGGLGRGGGGLVISLVAKSSTMIKDVSRYIVVRGTWLCVVADKQGWWKLRVA